MTVEEIIEGVLLSEGEGKPPYLVAGDKGGRTSWGISERAHPWAWKDGPPSKGLAKEIYRREYAAPWVLVTNDPLRAQLTDISVLHGKGKVPIWLQEVGLSVQPTTPLDNIVQEINIRLMELTTAEIPLRMLNNALVASRLGWIDRATDQDLGQKKFEEGWESRALRFLVRN